MIALYDAGPTVEAAPMVRNLTGHAYAINWLADGDDDAYKALIAESDDAHRKLLNDLQAVNWQFPEGNVSIGEAPDFGFTADEEKRHRRLVGELHNFNNMVQAYGTPMLHPV